MKTCKNCKHYKRSERIGIKVCEFCLHESYCEKDKEDFAIEELEKIKKEIKRAVSDFYMENSDIAYGLTVAECILDKHIYELKGESNAK